MSAETAATPAEPGSKPKRTRRLRTWLGELSTTVKAIGGVAAAIAAIVGLVFLFFPDLRPAPTPDEGSATLSKPTLEHPVTYASTWTGSRFRTIARQKRSWLVPASWPGWW